MKSIGFIPLRAGSKGIPGKNKKKLLGRPLYQWTLGASLESDLDEVYVFTDDLDIINQIEQEYKWCEKVKTMERSEESATDTASTEMAMMEFAERLNFDFDTLTLIQATSPLTTSKDINVSLEKVINGRFDSSLSVVESKRFIWSLEGKSINYDYLKRPRRQDFEGYKVENGAVYTCTKLNFIKNRNRIGGKIGLVYMAEDTLYEIDELEDWAIVSNLLRNRLKKQKGVPSEIKYLVLDVDGVFTDGRVATSAEGELFKLFSLRDGMGLEILRSNGIIPVVMTSEDSPIVKQRMDKLKIEYVFLGVKDKFTRLNAFISRMKINRSEIAYIGDDINDLSNLCSVGWSFSPNDAIDEIKPNVDTILNENGGDKAIREAVHFLIKFNSRF